MATWDQLFTDSKNILRFSQHEVIIFIERLQNVFETRPLSIWDLCCGAGRHSIAVAQMGHTVYANDISPNGIDHLNRWAADQNLRCKTAVSDMIDDPWDASLHFHGIICWDALHHNTLANIQKAVRHMESHLQPGGYLLATLMSTSNKGYGDGAEIEPGTFVCDDGFEAGVPHHYFSRDGIADLFEGWSKCIIAENIVNYVETEAEFYKQNPFNYTKWNLLLKKES
jgi:SAM-dependent methyltransferase